MIGGPTWSPGQVVCTGYALYRPRATWSRLWRHGSCSLLDRDRARIYSCLLQIKVRQAARPHKTVLKPAVALARFTGTRNTTLFNAMKSEREIQTELNLATEKNWPHLSSSFVYSGTYITIFVMQNRIYH